MKKNKGKAQKKRITPPQVQDVRSEGQDAKLHHILSVSLILIISIAIYSNTLKNGFVYDDAKTIVNNTLIKNLDNLPKLLPPLNPLLNKEGKGVVDYFAASGEMSYRPVVTLTYFIDYWLYGLKPWGYHLTNLILHSMNGVLLYIFLMLIIKTRCKTQDARDKIQETKGILSLTSNFLPLVSSLIFVTHPVLTEAVNAISFREDLLCFLFFISALILYISHRSLLIAHCSKFKAFSFQFSALSFYLLALLSKEMAITLPLIIFLYEWIYGKQPPLTNVPLNKGGLRGLYSILFNRYSIGYIIITFLYLYLRFYLFKNPVEETLNVWLLSERLMTIPYLILKYILLLIAPVSLSADYVITPVQSLISLKFIIPIIVIMIILLMVASLFFNLQSSIFNLQSMFGILFLLITLIPVYNAIPISNPLAERYLYLPMVGFAIIIGSPLTCLSVRSTQTGLMAHRSLLIAYCSLLIIISIYSFAVIKRNKIWADSYSLWVDTVIKMPESFRGHNNLGVVYEKQGRLDEAIKEYRMTLSLKPGYAEAHNNLGVVYAKQGQIDEAIKEFRTALSLKPGYAEAYNNLGIVYKKQGRLDEAIKEFRTALSLKPGYAEAHNNLGNVYEKEGQIDKAIEEYRMALSIKPDYVDAHNNLGIVYKKQGRLDEAIDKFLTVLKLNPDDPITHYNLAWTYNMKELNYKAIEELEFALRLKPDYTQARELLESLKMR